VGNYALWCTFKKLIGGKRVKKYEILRAGRRMQCLLRPGWILADYSIQLDILKTSK